MMKTSDAKMDKAHSQTLDIDADIKKLKEQIKILESEKNIKSSQYLNAMNSYDHWSGELKKMVHDQVVKENPQDDSAQIYEKMDAVYKAVHQAWKNRRNV